ncbi:MAG: PhnE/PtxC family ABC transporter permease [Verrucomicrobiales bacterium]|tara:strand:- start:1373 stop:2242 length:870 start_codon:yes stop_codon:yes gene_type:complete
MAEINSQHFHSFKSPLLGKRRSLLLWITLITLICGALIGLKPDSLINGNFKLASDFFKASLSPAIEYENPVTGAEPFLKTVFNSLIATLKFAILAMSVSIPLGAVLAFFSTTAWWPDNLSSKVYTMILRTLYITARLWIAFARSIHELIWGILFITAIGLSTEAAIIAVTIPFSGILAKIYAEIFEEHTKEVQNMFRSIGAGYFTSFVLGILPLAFPDLVSYTFYRLECAFRTAAVFGFVGIETIGYRIKLSSDEFHYHEVWTYLYVLFFTVAIIEWWGAKIREKLNSN